MSFQFERCFSDVFVVVEGITGTKHLLNTSIIDETRWEHEDLGVTFLYLPANASKFVPDSMRIDLLDV
ncbi:hypothetical protein WJ89_03820 [Burkholderia ubonensis]|nr:hypothetical protein WJ89_03820 [Burkholderia ubonensis]KVQ86238.1 hypothetical protein WK06_05015 [Burkholderia ubonensis]KVR11287.1 hypothetical protein WK12_15770 [Burkholderia ubonensis]KWD30001.1 hypothetical protein WL63_26135 [Burkholderia ubonensis]KWD31283.1 hypothetical protein WL64_27740 [Burkholderia ubonensis]